MIKMIVLDIDGTILGKSLKLSQSLKNCFERLISKGIKVVLATGRMYHATTHLAEELKLNTPVLCYQGGYIRNFAENTDVLREILVPAETVKELVTTIKEHSIHINIYAQDTLFVEEDNDIIQSYCVDRKIPYQVVGDFDKLEHAGYHKVLAIDYDTEKISNLIQTLKTKYEGQLYVTHSTPYFCEISNIEATKGDAIRFLADMWDIKKEEIMAVGDQENDIEMLMAAGIKVAMGNAAQALKDIADFITLDVEHDGVCYAVEKFIESEN